MSRITFKVLTFRVIVKEVLFKVLPQVRGGNDERNGIYSSPTEVISDAIFVRPLRGALARVTRVAQSVLKIAQLAISMEPTPLLEKISSYGLLPRSWLLVFTTT